VAPQVSRAVTQVSGGPAPSWASTTGGALWLVALGRVVVDTGRVGLLEREAQIASLAEYAGEARGGHGRLVLVAGEAGVGKSALVEQAQRDLPAASWFWGACDGLFTPRPLGPLFDIAAKLGGELLELCRADAPREELFGALLRQIAAPGPLRVLVVEDIHWADEATIDLLRFLGRRLRDAPVLLIATYRDDGLDAGHPLRLALGDLATQRTFRRIDLAPLSVDATAVLAAGSGLGAPALHELTGGNPFYLTEVLQAGAMEVPPSARDAALARAAGLPAAAREVLEAAALLGTIVEVPLLAQVTEAPAAMVDELLAAGLLRGDGAALRFRHEIARQAVAEAVPAHRRGLIHTQVLAALQAAGADDEARLAYHAEGAGDGPAALRYAAAAARRAAALGAHREAAAQYQRALRFAAGLPPADLAALHDGFADEASLLDHWEQAAAAREQAIELWRSIGDRRREGDSTCQLSQAMWRLCHGREAAVAAERAVDLLEPLGAAGAELARAYSNLAGLLMERNQHREAVRVARRAASIAASQNLPDVLSQALNTEGCAAVGTGADWAGPLRRALEIALARGLHGPAGRAFANLQSAYAAEYRFTEAERCFAAGIAYSEEHDLGTYATCLRGERARSLQLLGRWDEAVALSTATLAGPPASPVNKISLLETLGLIRARRGDPAAWECLDRAARYVAGNGEPQHIIPVRLARAEAHWLAGRRSGAQDEAGRAAEVTAGATRWERGAVAVWLRRTGAGRDLPTDVAEPYQRYLDGDWRGSAELWSGLGCPYEAALALLGSSAEEDLREAFRLLTGLGATATAGVARRRMRELGIRSIPAGPRSATREHPLGLTRREREVLDLICAGCTNAEIAGRLFISAKTVDHHVSAVLGKLGAPTRGAAAAEAARLGLAGLPGRLACCYDADLARVLVRGLAGDL
jgi:DNA-binding CsgD family transcriptional regulator/tetratricopeptide (TPR) repeat protein